MACSLTRTPQECTDPPGSTDALQKYEDELQDKTRKHLIDDCKALKTRNACLEDLLHGLQAEEIVKQNERLVAENRELTAQVEELTRKIEQHSERNRVAEKIKKLEEETGKIKKLEEEMEECKKQLHQAQEDVFKPILGILQRQQELQLNLYGKVRKRDDENPYEEIQPGPLPKEAVTTRQKEPSHPKFNNTVHGQHVTINQNFPLAHSLTKENLTKPPPHDNLLVHPPQLDQSLKAPVQSTDSQPTSREETDPASPNSEVMV